MVDEGQDFLLLTRREIKCDVGSNPERVGHGRDSTTELEGEFQPCAAKAGFLPLGLTYQ